MTTQGSNATRLRRLNERAVLNAVRAGGEMSKADIARATQLTPPAVSSIVRTLAGAELLEVKATRKGGVGSPSELFGLRERGAFSIGLHIGRLAMNSVLVDFCGHIIASFDDDYDFPRFDEVSRRALEHVGRLTNTLPKHEQARIAGLGVSIPHLFAFWGDELGFPSGVSEDWKSNDITRYLAESLNFRCSVRTMPQRLRLPNSTSASGARSATSSTSTSIRLSAAAWCSMGALSAGRKA